MHSFSILSAIVFAISLIFAFYRIFKKTNKKQNSILTVACLLISFSSLLLSISLNFSQELLEKNVTTESFQKIGPYGDLIGGIINPVVAFIGVIAASLAFYAQYRANQLVQDQFYIQKFESQFYEMLRMHRENLNEMQIEGYKFEYIENDSGREVKPHTKKEKLTTGKKIFVTLITEFEAIHLICTKIFYKHHPNNQILNSFEAKQLIFDHSYYIFFNGINLYRKNINRYVELDTTTILSTNLLHDYVQELVDKRTKHEEGKKEYYLYYFSSRVGAMPSKAETLKLHFNYKPFSGHQSLLAHYYRHLIQTVKFVVKQDSEQISYEEKRDYLRILRATLSNHEQILLYYNWLSGFGTSWEKKLESEHLNKDYNLGNNKFFTDYRMIHNIPDDMIIDDFKLLKIFDTKYQNFLYEKDRKDTDTLFEIMGIKTSKK